MNIDEFKTLVNKMNNKSSYIYISLLVNGEGKFLSECVKYGYIDDDGDLILCLNKEDDDEG